MPIDILEDGRLELDTNPVENQIRKIALTRKKAFLPGTRLAQRTGIARQPDRELQDVRRRSGQLPLRHVARAARRSSQKPHRRSHALELRGRVNPRRVGDRRGAYISMSALTTDLNRSERSSARA